MTTRYLGIVIPKNDYDKMLNPDKDTAVMFSIFEQTAKRIGITPCYFKLFQIKPNQDTIDAYVLGEDGYFLMNVPSPKVIYTRVLDYLPSSKKHIRSLQESGIKVFNVPNYDVEKYTIHQILYRDPSLRPYLPHTELLTPETLHMMMQKYDKLFLKPNYGECGQGAMKLEKNRDGWVLSYKIKGSLVLKKRFFKHTPSKIIFSRMEKTQYLIQEYIPLAKYYNKPFDMRVAAQKDEHGIFQVSAIMCKVAGSDDYLTNGAHGGKTYRLAEIAEFTNPSIPYEVLESKITSFGIYIAEYMNTVYPHIADLGFDIGVTKKGKPYFVECNFISDYVGGLIKNGEILHKDFLPIFSTPIEYAGYLFTKYDLT